MDNTMSQSAKERVIGGYVNDNKVLVINLLP